MTSFVQVILVHELIASSAEPGPTDEKLESKSELFEPADEKPEPRSELFEPIGWMIEHLVHR